MNRFEYNRKMIWATFWLNVWGAMNLLGIYPSIDHRWFSWIVSQTGFCYMHKFEDIYPEADHGGK